MSSRPAPPTAAGKKISNEHEVLFTPVSGLEGRTVGEKCFILTHQPNHSSHSHIISQIRRYRAEREPLVTSVWCRPPLRPSTSSQRQSAVTDGCVNSLRCKLRGLSPIRYVPYGGQLNYRFDGPIELLYAQHEGWDPNKGLYQKCCATCATNYGQISLQRNPSSRHTRIYPQTFHRTLALMAELTHQNLSLLNQKLELHQTYTRCYFMRFFISSK